MTWHLQTEALCITAVSGGSAKSKSLLATSYGMAGGEVLTATIPSNYKVEDCSLVRAITVTPSNGIHLT